MARALTIELNQLIPAGYLVLLKPIEFKKGKKYNKIWSEYWDVYLNKDKMKLSLEERKQGKNWIWHSVIDDSVVFHMDGENILEFVQTFTKPQNKEIFVIEKRKIKNGKVQKKASSSRSSTT